LGFADEVDQAGFAFGPRRVGAQQEFGVADHPCQRGAQVVGGVGEELAHAVLGLMRVGFGGFQGVEHPVEGRRGLPELGARSGGVQAPAAGAVADAVRQGGHPVQRPQGGVHHPDQQQPGEQHGGRTRGQLDVAEGVQGLVDPGLAGLQHQGAALDVQLCGELVPAVLHRDSTPGGGWCRFVSAFAGWGWWRGVVAADEGLLPGGELGGDALPGELVHDGLGGQVLGGEDLGELGAVEQALLHIGAELGAQHPVSTMISSPSTLSTTRRRSEGVRTAASPAVAGGLVMVVAGFGSWGWWVR